MKNLTDRYGKWALISGASAGIGKTFAYQLAKAGFNCVLVARRIDLLDNLARELSAKFKIKTLTVALDLTKENFLDDLKKSLGTIKVNILINNAGFGNSNYFYLNEPGADEKMVKLNCLAPVILTHHFLPSMLMDKKGAIIFLSSIGAIQPSPMCAVYSATKVFNLYLGEALSFELKDKGIDVLTVLPGITKTEFQQVSHFKDVKEGQGRTADDVVKTAFKYLGKKTSCIDGTKNRFNSFIMKSLPKKWQLFISHQYMSMRSTDHKRGF